MFRVPIGCLSLLLLACSGGGTDAPVAAPKGPTADESAPKQAGAGHITGLVGDAKTGAPISFATVSLLRAGDNKLLADAITDAKGRYSIANLEPGTYRLSVNHGARTLDVPTVKVRADETAHLTHKLESPAPPTGETDPGVASSKPGSIGGVVRDGAQGAPIGGVTIELTAPHQKNVVFTIAGDDGKFEIRDLRPATYVVSAYYSLVDKGNVEIRRSGVVVKAGEATDLELILDTDTQ